jgi:hypothetical protein
MDETAKPITDLPSDILLHIFDECDVLDILNLSSVRGRSCPYLWPSIFNFVIYQTCKQLQQAADEHQVWLRQARRLHIPIPPGTTPSKAELRDWVISRTRVDVCWVESRPADLTTHLFKPEGEFLDAHLIPGGEFVVLHYATGDVSLSRLEKSTVTGKLDLREVSRYEETNEDYRSQSWSGLLTETSYGCPVLVIVGEG